METPTLSSPRPSATFGGFLAIALWSATVGLGRILIESLGVMTAGAAVYSLSGVLGCAWLLWRPRRRAELRRLPRRYLLGCGGLFVLYAVCLYAATGLATGRQQVLVVGVINYLWPGLTLALSVPILGNVARPWLWAGIVMAFAGVALAAGAQGGVDWPALSSHLAADAWPYCLALVGAVSWALYSNFTRRWAGGAIGGAVPLFALATGVAMAALRLMSCESTRWSAAMAGVLMLIAVGPALLAYILWEAAMRWGDHTLVACAAYAAPLLSTGMSCALLGVLPGASLWAACVLVVAGAVICRLSVRSAGAAP